jgi:hypothetical protein
MKKTITDKKRKILRRIYGALSLTTAMFIFQACYGSPQDFGLDTFIQGTVKSKKTSLPVSGIKISIESKPYVGFTDNFGEFKIYTETAPQYKLKFEDIDGTTRGVFSQKDTIVTVIGESVHLNVLLDEN